MLAARPEGYKGKQLENGFTEFFITGNFYGVLSFEDGVSQEEGKKLLESFKEGLVSADIQNLSSFEHEVSDLILKLNFPAHVGIAVGMLYHDALYVKTVGNGQIYFRRGNTFDLLLSGDKTASGYLNQFDLAVFTTTKIQDLIGKTEDLHVFIEMAKPVDILQKLNDQEYGEEEQGFSALFVEFGETVQNQISTQVQTTPGVQPLSSLQSPDEQAPAVALENIQSIQKTSETQSMISKLFDFFRTKQFTIVAAVIILALLTWSVVFGYKRREAEKVQKRIETVSLEIDKKLSEAKEEAFLNMDQSLILIADAKTLVTQLKKEVGGKNEGEIVKIESKIQDAENKIVKKESKDFEEFYDLTLENKDAQGMEIAKEGELVAILDVKQNTIYVLDVTSKSLTKYVNKDVASAVAVGIYSSDVFFATSDNGLYKFTSQSKVNTIVQKDSDVKNIVDMELYNGNIYVLDEGADEIYKYLVTEGGYSDKKSYFGDGQTIRLDDATGRRGTKIPLRCARKFFTRFSNRNSRV